jgi:hypothetical protein
MPKPKSLSIPPEAFSHCFPATATFMPTITFSARPLRAPIPRQFFLDNPCPQVCQPGRKVANLYKLPQTNFVVLLPNHQRNEEESTCPFGQCISLP